MLLKHSGIGLIVMSLNGHTSRRLTIAGITKLMKLAGTRFKMQRRILKQLVLDEKVWDAITWSSDWEAWNFLMLEVSGKLCDSLQLMLSNWTIKTSQEWIEHVIPPPTFPLFSNLPFCRFSCGGKISCWLEFDWIPCGILISLFRVCFGFCVWSDGH